MVQKLNEPGRSAASESVDAESSAVLLAELAGKLNLIRGRELSVEGSLLLSECRTIAAKLRHMMNPGSLAKPSRSADLKRIKVLVIDDDEDLQRVLRYILPRRDAIEVHSLTEPAMIGDALKAIQPDVVLIDVLLPGTSGFTVLTELKRQTETRHIKVIVGSIRSYEKDRLSAMQLGADDFFAKPYNVEELVLRIRYHSA